MPARSSSTGTYRAGLTRSHAEPAGVLTFRNGVSRPGELDRDSGGFLDPPYALRSTARLRSGKPPTRPRARLVAVHAVHRTPGRARIGWHSCTVSRAARRYVSRRRQDPAGVGDAPRHSMPAKIPASGPSRRPSRRRQPSGGSGITDIFRARRPGRIVGHHDQVHDLAASPRHAPPSAGRPAWQVAAPAPCAGLRTCQDDVTRRRPHRPQNRPEIPLRLPAMGCTMRAAKARGLHGFACQGRQLAAPGSPIAPSRLRPDVRVEDERTPARCRRVAEEVGPQAAVVTRCAHLAADLEQTGLRGPVMGRSAKRVFEHKAWCALAGEARVELEIIPTATPTYRGRRTSLRQGPIAPYVARRAPVELIEDRGADYAG